MLLDPPTGVNRDDCQLSACTWTATVEDLNVSDTVEYYFKARDNSTVSSGQNENQSATYSFERGDPNKVFIVEWRDRTSYTGTEACTVQALFYDVTNEIEYKYDSGCRTSYEAWSIGYMDQNRQQGASIDVQQTTVLNRNGGYTPTTTNFRIGTDSTSHAWETFDKGLVEVANADSALVGFSSGTPQLYYCYSSYWWNRTRQTATSTSTSLQDLTFVLRNHLQRQRHERPHSNQPRRFAILP